MLARMSRLLIVLALAGSIGLHWAFLQVVAWTGMVISYSQEATLSQAVSETFDGKHPCALCKRIAEAKHAEKKPEFKFEIGKLEFPRACEESVLSPPSTFWEYRASDVQSRLLNRAPPSPPPRNLPS